MSIMSRSGHHIDKIQGCWGQFIGWSRADGASVSEPQAKNTWPDKRKAKRGGKDNSCRCVHT